MDPLVTTGLAASAVTGGLSLTALFKKTSKLTTGVAALTTLSSAATAFSSFAAENSVGGGGLVYAIALPAMMVVNSLGTAWNMAALYEGRATRKRIEAEKKSAATIVLVEPE